MHIIKIKQLFAHKHSECCKCSDPLSPHSPLLLIQFLLLSFGKHLQIHAKYTQNTHIHIPYTHSLTGPRIETNLNECSAASHGGTTWNETVTDRLRPQHERFANLSDISEANLSEYLKLTFDIFDVWFSFKLFNT